MSQDSSNTGLQQRECCPQCHPAPPGFGHRAGTLLPAPLVAHTEGNCPSVAKHEQDSGGTKGQRKEKGSFCPG